MTADEPAAPAPTPPPGPSKRRMSVVMLGLATVGIVIPGIAIAIGYKACVGAKSAGAIAVRGGGVDWSSPLGSCVADPTAFVVELGGGGPALVRATLDPLDGPRVELRVAWAPAPIVLTPATCPGLRVTVRRTGERADGSHLLDGSAAASCPITVAGGAAQLELDAWWRACHQLDE